MMEARYPSVAGFKEKNGTSQDAAKAVAGGARLDRERVFNALRLRPMTADEVASYLQRKPAAIRPRLSELRALGVIEATGDRRRNASGLSAAVWRVVPEACAA